MNATCLSALPLLLVSLAMPTSLWAQGARARGSAPVQGQAVPRGEAQRGAERQAPARSAPTRQAPAPQLGAARMPAPQRAAPPAVAPMPSPGTPARRAVPQEPSNRRAPAVAAQAVPRTVPRVIVPQGRSNDHPVYRPDYRPNYRPQYRAGYGYYRHDYRPRYRPYYIFKPRIRLGFGLWVGYPVVYPYYVRPTIVYPYPYTYPSTTPYPGGTAPYPYPAPSASVTPGTLGGLSFDINPPDADVYIDGQYYGIVSQFSPTQAPLWLAPGRHRVEIQEPGYQPVVFEVDILPGQVIPYQGDLLRF